MKILKMEMKKSVKLNLDSILPEIGEIGTYQIYTIALAIIPIIFSALAATEYIFTAGALPHRCLIEQCEANGAIEFEPSWLENAVPRTSSGQFDQCSRFVALDASVNISSEYCPATLFDNSSTQSCASYAHERTNTITYDFGLECQEWKRTLVGTLSSSGALLALAITGYVSDRFGRKIAMTINAMSTCIIGVIRVFSVNYEMFLALKLLESTFGSGAFSAYFLLSTEIVGAKYRVIAGIMINTFFATGQVFLGLLAWAFPEWKTLLLVLYVPQAITVAYFWIILESPRWLLSKGKYKEASEVLTKAAKYNGKQLSNTTFKALSDAATSQKAITVKVDLASEVSDDPEETLVSRIVKSPVMLRRVCTTPIWWITMTLVYYGLSINSVGLAGNMYVNYVLVSLIEIPGYWTAAAVLNIIGRKTTLSMAYITCGICCLSFPFVPNDLRWLSLILYLAGKFFISMVISSLYIYTAELYPTQYRHTLLGFSSMVGRIGGIVAPLTPALMMYWVPMPSVIFGCMALVAGCLVLTQPETLNNRLPDTIEQAERIGKHIECN